MQFDPFEAERKRQEAAAAERLNQPGAPPTEFSDVKSIAKIALERQGKLLRDSNTRTNHAVTEARLADPNDPYSLLRLNRQLAKEPEIDERTPLIRPIFRRFLRDLFVGVIGVAVLSCGLLLIAPVNFCVHFCFILTCAYLFSLGYIYFYIKM
jgi:hypothetical protein